MVFRTHQSPQHLRLIEVIGDSMSPTLKDGDFVLIDTSKMGGAQEELKQSAASLMGNVEAAQGIELGGTKSAHMQDCQNLNF